MSDLTQNETETKKPTTRSWLLAHWSEGRDWLLANRDKCIAETGSVVSHESYRRIIRRVANELGEQLPEKVEDLPATLRKLGERFTEAELQAILKGSSLGTKVHGSSHTIRRDGDYHTFGVMSDTHLGSLHTSEERIFEAFQTFREREIETILHPGDVVEGMSNRPGHYQELRPEGLGYTRQLNYATHVLSEWEGEIIAISGNHDRWFMKSNGADILEALASRLDKFHMIGHDVGDLFIETPYGVLHVGLWHGEDGASYATSYRIQKVVESFPGGRKPHVLLTGHVHKMGYFMERLIHALLSGAMQSQTPWMRSKRLPAHTGYWIITIGFNEDGVFSFVPEWFPFYEV